MMTKVSRPLGLILPSFRFSTFSKRNDTIEQSRNMGEQGEVMTQDAERIFEQFFNQNPPKESERSFFNEKSNVESFNPFQILKIEQTANRHTINEAYRKLAIEHHPRINCSQQAEQKFIEIARAYKALTSQLNESITNESFIEQFDNSVREQMKNEVVGSSVTMLNDGLCQLKIAQLYSESKKVKRLGNLRQIRIVKEYNRDGNLMKVTRVQKYDGDGVVSVEQIYENGDDMKFREFIKQSEVLENVGVDMGNGKRGMLNQMNSFGGNL